VNGYYPRKADGAKLTIFPEATSRLPEGLRELAGRGLAELEGRAPRLNSQPMLSFRVLEEPAALVRLKLLLQELLRRIGRGE